MGNQIGSLAIAIGVPMAGGVIGALVSAKDVLGWYQDIRKPKWTPPDLLFGNIWPVLYVLQGIASWIVWKSAAGEKRTQALTLYGVQLALNMIWNPLLFKTHKADLALVDMAAILGLATAATVSMTSATNAPEKILPLMGPYLGFLSFAAALNFEVWRLNPSERIFNKKGKSLDTEPGKPKTGLKGVTKVAAETGKALKAGAEAAARGKEAASAGLEAKKALDNALEPITGPKAPAPKKGVVDTVEDTATTAEKAADKVANVAQKVEQGAQMIKKVVGDKKQDKALLTE